MLILPRKDWTLRLSVAVAIDTAWRAGYTHVLLAGAMNDNSEHDLRLADGNLSFLQRNLADSLTVSRAVIGLIILSLSFVGKSAYLAVVVLTLAGVVTDILDGRVARHYFGENGEGRLGKHDVEIDTFLVLCVMGYFSLSGVIVHGAIGLGWIGAVVVASILSSRNLKVMVASEIITVIALLAVTLFYSPLVFAFVIAPAGLIALFLNRRRVLYLVFDYWPSLFSRWRNPTDF